MDMDHAHGHSTHSLSSRSSRGQHCTRQRPFLIPHTPSPVQPTRPDAGLSANQRRLQLRNDGFRGTRLSAQGISSTFSRIFHGHDEPQSAPVIRQDRENKPPSCRSLRGARSVDSLSTPLGILHEITNSTRSRQSQKRSTIPVFEDEPERPLLEASPETPASEYYDASSPPLSPAIYAFAHIDSGNMRLREVSGNERRNPAGLSSPLTKSLRSKKVRNLNLRKSSFDSIQYIESIESELATVKERQHSPNTGRPYVEKLRALQVDYKQLEVAFHDLEHNFEERIKEAMEHKTAMEGALRRKIKVLEDAVEEKESLIQELEYEHEESRHDQNIVEALKATIEKLELEKQSLEDSNRSMAKRNEVLTELLAMSPTKSQHVFEFASPVRDASRRTPRPRSMILPRLPTSPIAGRSSRRQSVTDSPAFSTSYFSPQAAAAEDSNHPCYLSDGGDPPKRTEDSLSIDSGLGESCSIMSPTAGNSRRSTLGSQVPVSPSAWGLPLPLSPTGENGTVRQTQKRKPRRFMSGSTQLKPLLLPTMTVENTSAQNSPFTQHTSPGRRDISEESMDPTVSFISRPYEHTIRQEDEILKPTKETGQMPEQSCCYYSHPHEGVLEHEVSASTNNVTTAFARDAFKTPFRLPLEPDSPSLLDDATMEEEVAAYLQSDYSKSREHSSLSDIEETSPETVSGQVPIDRAYEPLQTLDLEMPAADLSAMKASPHMYTPISQDIDESVELSDPALSPTTNLVTLPEYYDLEGSDLYLSLLHSVRNSPTPNPKKRRKSSSSPKDDYLDSPPLQGRPDPTTPTPYPGPRKMPTPTSTIDKVVATDLSPSNPYGESQSPARSNRSARPRSPLEILQQRAVTHRPIAAVTIQTIYGTLSRYTSYIREIKRDPMGLARRVIANAWCSNWKRLGKLSWWVLGLFLGSGARRDYAHRLGVQALDWDVYDGESIAERVRSEEEDSGCQPPNDSSGEATRSRRVKFDERNEGYPTSGSRSPARSALNNGKERRTSWGRSLYLWGKFSVAILLAVGGAVVKGPAEMLKDCDEYTKSDSAIKNGSIHSRVGNAEQTPDRSSIMDSLTHFNFSMDCEPDDGLDHGNDVVQDHDGTRPPDRSTILSPPKPVTAIPLCQFATPASAPLSEIFTFGSPYHDGEWKRFENNGKAESSRARSEEYQDRLLHRCVGRHARRQLYDPESPGLRYYKDDESGNRLGTLKWMQSQGMTNFADVQEHQRRETEGHD